MIQINKTLIVDDDNEVRLAVSENLRASGFSPIEASNGKEAIEIFKKEEPALVLLDLQMPGMSGMETIKELKKINPDIPVIILTAHGDISTAVEIIKLGAYDFLIKPPDFDMLILTLKRASEKLDLRKKIEILNSEVETSLEYLLGKSKAIKEIIQQIHQISYSDLSLIIQGETGTGKSFIARTIHNLSKRAKGPFIAIDIGSIPETLIESELFGYEKGAFTGAEKKKKGFFEIASGGTMLIDELQNLSPYVQSKLLMAAEEKEIYPLGSTNPVITDVRIIGASNSDIIKAVKEKKSFREDLFYRLSEVMITLPPLRERREDIPFFAEKFFRESAEDMNKQINLISESALSLLINYSWPGNIRELKNVIRRAVLFSDKEIIRSGNIKFLTEETNIYPESRNSSSVNDLPSLNLTELEKIAIRKALSTTNGNKTKAASLLNISYMTLLRKVKLYNIL